jgi:hypothetical protein
MKAGNIVNNIIRVLKLAVGVSGLAVLLSFGNSCTSEPQFSSTTANMDFGLKQVAQLDVLAAEIEVFDEREQEDNFYELISYSGTVIYSVNLEKAEISIYDNTRKIIVELPPVEIDKPRLRKPQTEFSWQKGKLTGSLKAGLKMSIKGDAQAQEAIYKQAENDMYLRGLAKENARMTVQKFVENVLVEPYSGYQVTVHIE